MWWIAVADAHDGGVPEPIGVHAPSDRVGLETTLGWFERTPTGWRWACPEPLLREGAKSLPRYTLRADGLRVGAVVVAGDAASSVVSTTVEGCEWTAAAGLEGVDVGGLAFGPDGTLWLAADAPGAVWSSADDGRGFVRELDQPGWRIRSVVATSDGVWAAAGNEDAGALWRRRDGTWERFEMPTTGDVEVLAALGDVAWVRVDPFGSDRLLRFDGTTFEEVLEGDGLEILDVELTTDGRVWAIVGGRFLYRSDDGGRSFARVVDAPETTAIAAQGDALWLATRSAVEHVALVRLEAGVYTDELDLLDVLGPLDCPAESATAKVCDAEWPVVQSRFPGFDTGGGDTSFVQEDPGPRCGCAAAAAPGPAWLLVFAVLARRRQNQVPSASRWFATTT